MNELHRNDPLFEQAAALPDEIAPQRDLWPGVAIRLDDRAVPAPSQPRRWPLALAAGVALVALTSAVTWRFAATWFTPPPAATLATLAGPQDGAAFMQTAELLEMRSTLLASLRSSLSRLPSDSQRIVADNLLEIRASLLAIETALAQDPDNASLQQLLHTTYEQELAMLVSLNRVTLSLPVEVET